MRAALLLLVLLAPAALAATTTRFSWDGQTSTSVCPVYPQSLPHYSCVFAEQPSGTWAELERGATRVAGEVTFTPRTQAQQVMRVYVFGMPEGNAPPVSAREFVGRGSVPFDVDLSTLPGARHAVSIHGDYRGVQVSAVGAIVEVAQPFHAEMDVTVG